MDQRLIAEILTSDSDEIADLKANIPVLDGFIELAKQLDALPDTNKRFYEDSRSLFQATSTGRDIVALEALLSKFFGPPVKPAGKPLPRKLRKSSSVKHLGGIEKDQSFFLLNLKTGEFYAALWPWHRNKAKIEIHLGYCSDWITDQDYLQIERLVKRTLSQNTFRQLDAAIGGQIHGISLPSFLQMSEMERANFSLRVISDNRVGYLFLKDGVLVSAQTGDQTGPEAAYRIISWDNISIEIAPPDDSKKDELKQPLMHILMESLKLKDEATAGDGPPDPIRAKSQGRARSQPQLVRLERAPIPRQPSKRIRPLTLLMTLVVLLMLTGLGLVAHLHIQTNRKMSDGYRELMQRVEQTSGMEEKLIVLRDYLANQPQSPHRPIIENEMTQLRLAVEDHDFEQITLMISNLEVDEQYEHQAISMYGTFLEKYPGSRYTERINKSIADIKELLDQYYYEELRRAARLDLKARLKTYRDYVARFPGGRFRNDVEILVQEMGRQYLGFLRTEAEQCEKSQRWDHCIARAEDFAEAYAGTLLAPEAASFKNEMTAKRDLGQLRKSAGETGTDYLKAYSLYKNYLAENPQSTQHVELAAEIARLEKKLATQRKWQGVQGYATNAQNPLLDRIQRIDGYLRANQGSPYVPDAQALLQQLDLERRNSLRQRQVEAQRQEELARLQREKAEQEQRQRRITQLRNDLEKQLSSSPRFRSKADGTVTDLKTGLTWCLLDASQELSGCLSYRNAQNYVRTLRHGGFDDWRLPTAAELAAIYKQPPFFPPSGTDWYWTSESYVKGYHTVVNIVTAEPKSIFERDTRGLDECGGVRAVRP
jgi:hypothetical protein